MKYPYIGEGRRGSIVLFSADSSGFALSHENKTVKGKYTNHWDERAFTDITHEYLQNTWGVVESKEHAEFIIELAELHGFEFVAKLSGKVKYFRINESYVGFYETEIGALNIGFQKITIPLPPKEPLKNAGDNLILGCEDSIENLCNRVAESILKKNPIHSGCEDSKCDEWPQVGDKAAFVHGSVQVTILGIDGKHAWVSCRPSSREKPCTVKISDLQKPKTPEEELRDEVTELVWKANDLWTDTKAVQEVSVQEFVATKILAKYNITKKPQ